MKITGTVRPGSEFQFEKKASHMADSTFAAFTKGEVIVTRRFTELCHLPDTTAVLAHWHGCYRTEGFATTIGELKSIAEGQDLLC